MISHATAYWLGAFHKMYASAILREKEYWKGSKSEEDFDIAIAIIPRVLSDTETRMNIRIFNPMHGLENYQRLDTVHPDDVEAYVKEVDAFINGFYGGGTVVRFMPELSDTTP